MEEVWKVLDEYPEYEISSFGMLFSRKTGTQIKPDIRLNNNYIRFKIRKEHKRIHLSAHKIVYETFVGKIPEGYELHHRDGDVRNNSVDNLQIVTKREHRQIHSDQFQRKRQQLNEEELRLLLFSNLSQREIQKRIGRKIRNRSYYKKVKYVQERALQGI